MELTERRLHVLQYLAQEMPLKWQDRDCASNLSGAAARLALAAASIDHNAGYCLRTVGSLDVENMERIPSYHIRDAAMACGKALAYLELTAALQGWDPQQVLPLAENGYSIAHGENGFEKPAREHGMDEVGYRHASPEQRAEWVRVLTHKKPAGAGNTDELSSDGSSAPHHFEE